MSGSQLRNRPAVGLLLREHPQDEASFPVGFERGRDDDVLSGRQFESVAHLPQVDEGLTASHRRPPQQHLRAQADVTATFILTAEEEEAQRFFRFHTPLASVGHKMSLFQPEHVLDGSLHANMTSQLAASACLLTALFFRCVFVSVYLIRF